MRLTGIVCCLLLAWSVSAIAAEPDPIVEAGLLVVKNPRNPAEARLRVLKLTTRAGVCGYGDFLDFGLSPEDLQAALTRLVNRYAEQGFKRDQFLTDPSLRPLGAAQTVLGQSAPKVLGAWGGFGNIWHGPGRAELVVAMETALRDLLKGNPSAKGKARVCPSFPIEGQQETTAAKAAALQKAGFTALRLELSGSLEQQAAARGECAPYSYPNDLLTMIDGHVAAARRAAGPDLILVLAAHNQLSTDGMTRLLRRLAPHGDCLLANPMALRHLGEQAAAQLELTPVASTGGRYDGVEDFLQAAILLPGGTWTPDAGWTGGIAQLEKIAEAAAAPRCKIAPHVQGGPLSLAAAARALSGVEGLQWISAPEAQAWFEPGGPLLAPLRLEQGQLVLEPVQLDPSKFTHTPIAMFEKTNP